MGVYLHVIFHRQRNNNVCARVREFFSIYYYSYDYDRPVAKDENTKKIEIRKYSSTWLAYCSALVVVFV